MRIFHLRSYGNRILKYTFEFDETCPPQWRKFPKRNNHILPGAFDAGLGKNLKNILLPILFCLTALEGCEKPEERKAVPLSVRELSTGSISAHFNISAEPGFEISLHPRAPDRPDACWILTDIITAKLNGVPPTEIVTGSVAQGEGTPSGCTSPFFTFAAPTPASPGAPDGVFIILDGLATVQFIVKNLVSDRKLLSITNPATLKPGDQIQFSWQPETDAIDSVQCWVSGPGFSEYSRSCDARAMLGKVIADLPIEPWPSGSIVTVDVNAKAAVVKCEGAQKCELELIRLQEKLNLPNP